MISARKGAGPWGGVALVVCQKCAGVAAAPVRIQFKCGIIRKCMACSLAGGHSGAVTQCLVHSSRFHSLVAPILRREAPAREWKRKSVLLGWGCTDAPEARAASARVAVCTLALSRTAFL